MHIKRPHIDEDITEMSDPTSNPLMTRSPNVKETTAKCSVFESVEQWNGDSIALQLEGCIMQLMVLSLIFIKW